MNSSLFAISAILLGLLINTSVVGSQIMAEEMKRDSNIGVVLKVVWTDEIAKLFREASGAYPRGLYLLGEIVNNYSNSVSVRLKVWSSNNPAIPVNEITVGWVPPNASTPVYFMRYLSQPPMKTSIEEVRIEYEVLSVTRK
jgi:hypothetical protein